MMAGMCRYRDITESRVSLGDLAIMNELLDLRDYNDWVAQERARVPDPRPSPFDVFRQR
jgi:hypothetical protein